MDLSAVLRKNQLEGERICLNVHMDRGRSIHLSSAEHLCEVLEKMIALLVETGNAFGVVSVGDPGFMQVMAHADGGLRLESSSSEKVLAADFGFNERLDQFEHIAATNFPSALAFKERYVAKLMTRLAVEVHGVEFPKSLEFDVNELAIQP